MGPPLYLQFAEPPVCDCLSAVSARIIIVIVALAHRLAATAAPDSAECDVEQNVQHDEDCGCDQHDFEHGLWKKWLSLSE